MRARSESSSRSSSRTSKNRDRVRVSNAGNMIILQMHVRIWFPMILIEKVMVQDEHHYRFWQIVIQVQMWNNI